MQRRATANPSTDGSAASHRQRAAPAISTLKPSHRGISQNHKAKNAPPTVREAAVVSQRLPGPADGSIVDCASILIGVHLQSRGPLRDMLLPEYTLQNSRTLHRGRRCDSWRRKRGPSLRPALRVGNAKARNSARDDKARDDKRGPTGEGRGAHKCGAAAESEYNFGTRPLHV